MSDLKYVRALRKGQYDLPGTGTPVDVKPGLVFQVPAALKIGVNSWLQECDKDGRPINPIQVNEEARDLRAKANAKKEAVALAQAEYKLADAKADEAEKRAKEAAEGKLEAEKPKPSEPGVNPNKDLVTATGKPVVHSATNPVPFPKK